MSPSPLTGRKAHRQSDNHGDIRPVDAIHLGPQKSGTTWLYECLEEHPHVACARKDSIHYYDMFYHKGPEWYAGHFIGASRDQILFDTTPSYIRSSRAPRRISSDNPHVKLAVTLRHPVERAFSHYWHERKDPRRQLVFSEILTNYDMFASWLEPGFYADHIERYLNYFPREQLLCQSFDQLKQEPHAYLREILGFLGVDTEFMPSCIATKINDAKCVRTRIGVARVKARGGLTRILGNGFLNTSFAQWITDSQEYRRGIEAGLYNQLLEICLPEIERTESLLNVDLSHWKVFRQ